MATLPVQSSEDVNVLPWEALMDTQQLHGNDV